VTRLADSDRYLGVTHSEIETRAVFRQRAVGKDGLGSFSGLVMLPLLKVAVAIGFALVLSACGSLPPANFEQASRVDVRRVCLTTPGVPERPQVTIMNPIGASFGVVGNYIESRRAAGAQQEMQAVLAKASYNYESALSESVFVAMSKAGFAMVHSVESRPEKERSRFMEHYPAAVKRVDAYLDVYAEYIGFQAMRSSEEYWPHLEISARLVDAKSGKILYQGRIVYGFSVATDEDAVLVHAENTFRFRDRTALQANPSVTARALQGAIDAVAWELAKQFM
jgi:hypothetical protein